MTLGNKDWPGRRNAIVNDQTGLKVFFLKKCRKTRG